MADLVVGIRRHQHVPPRVSRRNERGGCVVQVADQLADAGECRQVQTRRRHVDLAGHVLDDLASLLVTAECPGCPLKPTRSRWQERVHAARPRPGWPPHGVANTDDAG